MILYSLNKKIKQYFKLKCINVAIVGGSIEIMTGEAKIKVRGLIPFN